MSFERLFQLLGVRVLKNLCRSIFFSRRTGCMDSVLKPGRSEKSRMTVISSVPLLAVRSANSSCHVHLEDPHPRSPESRSRFVWHSASHRGLCRMPWKRIWYSHCSPFGRSLWVVHLEVSVPFQLSPRHLSSGAGKRGAVTSRGGTWTLIDKWKASNCQTSWLRMLGRNCTKNIPSCYLKPLTEISIFQADAYLLCWIVRCTFHHN